MTEKARIRKLFSDLYSGSPWIDINITGSVSDLTATEAAAKPIEGLHSVWEIVNHIIDWRMNVLRRVKGEVLKTPAHNYFKPVAKVSAMAWQQTLEALEKSQHEWMKWLSDVSSGELELVYAVNGLTYYEHIQGILQHDA